MLFALASHETYDRIAGGAWLKRPTTITPAAGMMKTYHPAAARQANTVHAAPIGVADHPLRLPTFVSLESRRSP